MEALSVYHGAIGKTTAEQLLGAADRDGSYLIRDSQSRPETYCICVLCKGVVYTYRLYQIKDGFWTTETAPGVQQRFFRKVKNLITVYQCPNQGIAMPLLYPVNNNNNSTDL